MPTYTPTRIDWDAVDWAKAGIPRRRPDDLDVPPSIATVPFNEGNVADHPMLPGVTIEIALLDDVRANGALLCNVKNRPQRERHRSALGRDMEDAWIFDGSGNLRFNWRGELDNGQHTCEGAARSKVPVLVTIVRGLDPAAWHVMDTNAGRRARDELERQKVPNAQTVQSLAGLVHKWTTTAEYGPTGSSSTAPTVSEILSTVVAHPEIIRAAQFAADGAKHRGRPVKINKTALAAGWWLFSLRHGETGQWFMDRIVDGVGVGGGQPGGQVLAFRDAMSRQADTGAATYNMMDQLTCLILTWNAFQKPEEIDRKMLERPRGGFGKRLPPVAGNNGLNFTPNGKPARSVPAPVFASA